MTKREIIKLTKAELKKHGIEGYTVKVVPQRDLQVLGMETDLLFGQAIIGQARYQEREILFWDLGVRYCSRYDMEQTMLHEVAHVLARKKLDILIQLLNTVVSLLASTLFAHGLVWKYVAWRIGYRFKTSRIPPQASLKLNRQVSFQTMFYTVAEGTKNSASTEQKY